MISSDCNDLERFYGGFRKTTAKSLCEFETHFVSFAFHISEYVYEVSILSTFINFLHIFILTRKPMRTSSINILMVAVALFDILSSLIHIETFFERHSYLIFTCFPTDSYGLVLTNALLIVIKDYSRRCSTWLIVFIALIRTLIIQNPFSPKHVLLKKPRSSFIVIAGISAASLPISTFKFLEYQLIEKRSHCPCAPKGTYYLIALSELFSRNDGYLAKHFNFFNSFVSDIIPCILLPLFTCSLVMVLLKRKKDIAGISSFAKNNNSQGNTGLVFCVAIMFFIVEFPFGLSVGSAWFFINSPGVQNILSFFGYMFTVLISVNTCTHLFVCLIMSSQYRSTTVSVLSCGYISQGVKVERRSKVFSSAAY